MSLSDESTNDRPVDVAMVEALLMLLKKEKGKEKEEESRGFT